MTDITAIIFIVFFIAAQLIIAKSFYLLKCNFWVDEILTYEMATTSRIKTMMSAIVCGLDTNPPAFHLLMRLFRIFIVKHGEITLRCLAFFHVFLGGIGIYCSIRMTYTPLVASLTALAIFVHPAILRHCFNARMYGLWFSSAVWFAFLLSILWHPPYSFLPLIPLALTSLLVCMSHTFGLVALLLVMGFQVLFHGLEYSNWPVLTAVCLGPVVFSIWIPVFLRQKDAYGVAWPNPTSKETILFFLNHLLFPRYLPSALFIAGFSGFLLGFDPQDIPSDTALPAGLAGLALFAAALVIISLATSEPILVVRYGLPTVAGLSPAIAAILALTPPAGYLAIGLLFLVGTNNLRKLTAEKRTRDQKTSELVMAIRRNTGDAPVFFESPQELYVIRRYASDLAGRCFAIDFQKDELGYVDGIRQTDRDQNRIFSKHFDGPDQVPWTTMRRFSKHYIVPSQQTLQQGFADAWNRYPGFWACKIEAGLYCLESC